MIWRLDGSVVGLLRVPVHVDVVQVLVGNVHLNTVLGHPTSRLTPTNLSIHAYTRMVVRSSICMELLTDNPFLDARLTSSRLVKRVDDEHFEGFPRREAHLVSSRVRDKENPLRILLLFDFLLTNWRIQRRDVGCVEIEHSGFCNIRGRR